jgi:hypothetical protein
VFFLFTFKVETAQIAPPYNISIYYTNWRLRRLHRHLTASLISHYTGTSVDCSLANTAPLSINWKSSRGKESRQYFVWLLLYRARGQVPATSQTSRLTIIATARCVFKTHRLISTWDLPTVCVIILHHPFCFVSLTHVPPRSTCPAHV